MKRRTNRRKTQRRVAALLVGAFIISLAMPCFADNAFHKLKRGVINSATGWIEVPKAIYEESGKTNPFTGLVYGSIKGSGLCVIRTGAGALDTGTFLFPKYDEPPVEPEYLL